MSSGDETVRTILAAGILDELERYDPVIVGTFPLGLDRPGSDVDVLCHAEDLDGFVGHAMAAFADRPGLSSHRRQADDGQPDAAVVRFLVDAVPMVDAVPVELFAQPVPTRQQRGFRHYDVERRLLELGGPRLRDAVRAARRDGDSVEVAFAQVLRLPGDPYVAMLELANRSDDELRIHLATSTTTRRSPIEASTSQLRDDAR